MRRPDGWVILIRLTFAESSEMAKSSKPGQHASSDAAQEPEFAGTTAACHLPGY